MNVLIAPAIYMHTGFAKGHYTARRGIKVARVTVGRNCIGGVSLQWHSKDGIRYVDVVLWKMIPWLLRMKMSITKEVR